MTFRTYLEKIKVYSKSTAKTYSSYEELFVKYKGDLEQIKLAHRTSNSTLRIILSALKQYRDFRGMKKIQISLPKKEVKVQGWVSYENYLSILFSLRGGGKKKQEMRCIVKLLFETGIRASELLTISNNDLIKNKLRIKGKGNRERMLSLSDKLAYEIRQLPTNVNDLVFDFTYKNLYARVGRLKEHKKITPHMFRRGYARYCYNNGISIYDLSLTMGHSSISTTSGYINKTSEEVDVSHLFQDK